jgi:omega-6 fatty acid desaturase (delta-12 desaturase)
MWVHSVKDKFVSTLTTLLPLGEGFFVVVDVVMMLTLGWPIYLLVNVTGGETNWQGSVGSKTILNVAMGKFSHFSGFNSELFPPNWVQRVNISAAGVIAFLAGLGYWASKSSVQTVVCWYFLPYLVTNAWLVGYTFLQHTHEDVPHFSGEAYSWLRGALCTIDRPYSPLINHLHHNIGSTHVLHHLNSRIPSYHADEATEAIKKVLQPLGLYRYDGRPVWKAMFYANKDCKYIESVAKGVYFYKKVDAGADSKVTKVPAKKSTKKKGDEDEDGGALRKVPSALMAG